MKLIRFFSLLLLGSLSIGLPAAADQPIKVFLLSGQSNMTGRGNLGIITKPAADQRGTLWHLIQKPANQDKYQFLHQGPKRTQ